MVVRVSGHDSSSYLTVPAVLPETRRSCLGMGRKMMETQRRQSRARWTARAYVRRLFLVSRGRQTCEGADAMIRIGKLACRAPQAVKSIGMGKARQAWLSQSERGMSSLKKECCRHDHGVKLP